MEIRDLDPGDAQPLTALYHTFEWWDDRDVDRVRQSIAGADAVVGLVAEAGDGVDGAVTDAVDVPVLALNDGGTLVGTARIVTDGTYYARIYDVLLADGVRGDGRDERLVRGTLEHPLLNDVDNVTLSCRAGLVDFYERCGFERHDGWYEQGGEEERAVTMYWQPAMDGEGV